MSHWWIIDSTKPGCSRTIYEWLSGPESCPGQTPPEMPPEHVLLLGLDAQTAVDVRKRLAERDNQITIHTLLDTALAAFDGAPETWLPFCLQRLLQKNGATSAEIHPQPAASETGLDPDQLLGMPPAVPASAPSAPPGKPPLAFVSPLPPSETGIADYSAALLGHLGAHYAITLVVESLRPELPDFLQSLPWLSAGAFRRKASDFDRIVYQIGNSRYHAWQFNLLRQHPGLVVLHDYYLFDAVWWREKAGLVPNALRYGLYRDHGYPAVAALDAPNGTGDPEQYPVNGEIVNEAAGLVFHSRHALAAHRCWYPGQNSPDAEVIPHLRGLPAEIDRPAARRALGLDESMLVIASFGRINPKKGVDRVIDAFLNMSFDAAQAPLLVFAGAGDAGAYGENMRKRLKTHPRGMQVRITGYLSADEYRKWLQAVDIAVQLRFRSRGETSGAVLDAMAHGLPLIVNAHGSNSELPQQAVCLLPEDPSAGRLQAAMAELAASPARRQALGRQARAWICRHNDPEAVAAQYSCAIEKHQNHPVLQQKQWFDRLAADARRHPPARNPLISISRAMQQLQVLHTDPPPRILVDISTIIRYDRKTGVERVTRELARQLLINPPDGYRVELVCWQDDDFYLAVDYAATLLGLAAPPAPGRPAEAGPGDIYLSMEWAPPLLEKAAHAFEVMKAAGVRFCFTVHDLLPMSLPGCFPAGTEEKMRGWFHRIANLADGLLCVSASVAATVAVQLQALPPGDRPAVSYFHPGADFSQPADSRLKFNEKRLLKKIDASPRPRLLMVGTIEPRKGHGQVLEAIERLWGQNQAATLVMVGSEGWDVQPITGYLKKHPEKGRRLFWCARAGDALLEHLYQRADLLVAASLDEGFGLPLVEAAHHELPVLARDIPVFREVAGDYARYFDAVTGARLAEDIACWRTDWLSGRGRPAAPLSFNTWSDSATQLKAALFESLSKPTRKNGQRYGEFTSPGGNTAAGPCAKGI